MAEVHNSAFDVLSGLTVEEALSNPHFMPDLILDELNGAEFQRVFFRDVTVNSNIIGFREATPNFLEDDVANVAEYGEIPVSDPTAGELKTAAIEKLGIGIRVSWEQRNDNDMDAVRRELEARTNTIIRAQARDALKALNAANIQEHQITTAWDKPDSDPAGDFLDASEVVLGAEDGDGHYFGYTPDVLLIHPMTLNLLKRNPEVQKLYIGDMAHANPLFNGIADEPVIFGNVQIVKSFFVPKGEAYLGQQQAAGFMGQREPEWVSEFYEERGNSGRGGANQSWRSDYTHRRGFAVDGPKSIVKLTGLVTE